MKLSRKQFLWLGGAGTLALLGLPLGSYFREVVLDGRVSKDARDRLADFFKTYPGAAEIGRAFEAASPAEISENRLARRILEKLPGDFDPTDPAADLEAALHEAQSRDWDTSEPRVVRGWLMTELEVLLCQLASRLV